MRPVQTDSSVLYDGLPESRDLRGQTLDDKYELLSKVAEGAMGEIYEARHTRLGRRFAIKVIRPELLSSKRAMQRFKREMLAVSRIESDYIVPALDCGFTNDNAPYYVMEFLRGADLRDILRREGPLSVRRTIRLALDVCRGLEVLHENGLVHRDLKPANVFVSRDEEGSERTRVLDLGLVQVEASGSTSRAGTLIGTARYMAPEQARAEGPVDQRADIYALGAVIFECLTGKPPHPGDSLEEVLFGIVNSPVPSLAERRPGIPVALDETVRRALARDPEQRYATVGELAAALRSHLKEGDPRPLEADELDQTIGGSTDRLAQALPRSGGARWPRLLTLSIPLILAAGAFALYGGFFNAAKAGRGAAAASIAPTPPRTELPPSVDTYVSLTSSVAATAIQAAPETTQLRRSRPVSNVALRQPPTQPVAQPGRGLAPLTIDPTNPYASSK